MSRIFKLLLYAALSVMMSTILHGCGEDKELTRELSLQSHYHLITHGTCHDHGCDPISSEAGCSAAAIKLRLNHTNVLNFGTLYERRPYGCLTTSAQNRLDLYTNHKSLMNGAGKWPEVSAHPVELLCECKGAFHGTHKDSEREEEHTHEEDDEFSLEWSESWARSIEQTLEQEFSMHGWTAGQPYIVMDSYFSVMPGSWQHGYPYLEAAPDRGSFPLTFRKVPKSQWETLTHTFIASQSCSCNTFWHRWKRVTTTTTTTTTATTTTTTTTITTTTTTTTTATTTTTTTTTTSTTTTTTYEVMHGDVAWSNGWAESLASDLGNKGWACDDHYMCYDRHHEGIPVCCENGAARLGTSPHKSSFPLSCKEVLKSQWKKAISPFASSSSSACSSRRRSSWSSSSHSAWDSSMGSLDVSKMQECIMFGDPHIVTFDNTHLVFYREGDFWLIKSNDVKIQGRFQATDWTKQNDKTDYSSMTSIIVGGSFMDGHRIEVQSMLGQITCDGHRILTDFGTQHCGKASLKYDDQGELVDAAMSFLKHRIVHLILPGPPSIILQVNRWPNFINALIRMNVQSSQDGVCGNANGDQSDDTGSELHKRFGQGIPQDDVLFENTIPLHIPVAMPNEKRCPPDRLARAKEVCEKAELSYGWSFPECLADVCLNHARPEVVRN